MAQVTSHYGLHVDSDVPVTGVISNNDICQFISDEICAYSIDLGWDAAVEEREAELGRELTDCESDELSMMMDGGGPHLIGDWKKDPETGEYEPDEEGEHRYSAIVRETVTQVLRSDWTVRCALCSPCYPGQGDVRRGPSGEYLAFTLPADAFDYIVS